MRERGPSIEKAVTAEMERAVPPAPSRKTRAEFVRDLEEEADGAKIKLHLPKE